MTNGVGQERTLRIRETISTIVGFNAIHVVNLLIESIWLTDPVKVSTFE